MKLDDFLSRISIRYNNWNDYGYCQTAEIIMPETNDRFYVHIFPNDDQSYAKIKKNELEKQNEKRYFYCSDEEYYEQINKLLESEADRERWFELTGDLAYMTESFIEYYRDLKTKISKLKNNSNDEKEWEMLEKEMYMFKKSFFRDIPLRQDWEDKLHQLHRLTIGQDYLSEYSFDIYNNNNRLFSVNVNPKDNIVIDEVNKDSALPYSVSNNVFAIIGDNGTGKTTFIKNLAKAFLKMENRNTGINIKEKKIDTKENANSIDKILYVSFSPFDSKIQINEDESRLRYIGIHDFTDIQKNDAEVEKISLSDKMSERILESLNEMINRDDARKTWFQLMNRVSSERWIMKICIMMEDGFTIDFDKVENKHYRKCKDVEKVTGNIQKLSSGQKIFLLSLTRITLEMTERTVVFFDEPELFLHPPLIKAYIRLIADVISKYNGLAFIVTHSPITIQEIPDKCVKIAKKEYGEYVVTDIDSKTFGESISNINEIIFNIGLVQTGYYNLIEILNATGELEKNKHKLNKILGSEGKVLMKYLIENKQ